MWKIWLEVKQQQLYLNVLLIISYTFLSKILLAMQETDLLLSWKLVMGIKHSHFVKQKPGMNLSVTPSKLLLYFFLENFEELWIDHHFD